jgi:hypothetical protein
MHGPVNVKFGHFIWCLMNEWSCTSAVLNVPLWGNFTTTFRAILCPDAISLSYPVTAAALCRIAQLFRTGSSGLKALIRIDCTVEVTRVCNLECFPLFFFRVTALKDGCWTWTTCLQGVRYWILTPQGSLAWYLPWRRFNVLLANRFCFCTDVIKIIYVLCGNWGFFLNILRWM